MISEKIILTKDLFRVLSSDTRITILKKLANRRMTISELSRDLKIAKSTVHEHLVLLTAVGLTTPAPDEHQWKFHWLLWRQHLFHVPQDDPATNVPHERATCSIYKK